MTECLNFKQVLKKKGNSTIPLLKDFIYAYAEVLVIFLSSIIFKLGSSDDILSKILRSRNVT